MAINQPKVVYLNDHQIGILKLLVSLKLGELAYADENPTIIGLYSSTMVQLEKAR
jgi:hypothetical protein